MPDTLDLAHLRELAELISQLPWQYQSTGHDAVIYAYPPAKGWIDVKTENWLNDAAYIVAAANALPALIAEVTRLMEALEFYADHSSYVHSEYNDSVPIEDDGGAKARNALKGGGNE